MIRPPCAPTLAGRAVDLNELTDKIKELYNKFSRLVALLFDLQEPFERFGIELRRHAAGENPLAILDRIRPRIDGFALCGRLCLRHRL